MSDGRQAKKASIPGSEDRISVLPEGVLQHVIGFLAARDAVRTSVLARRWRHAWRSMRRLHISAYYDGCNSAKYFKGFLDTLLFPGDHGSILEEVKLDFDGSGMFQGDPHIKAWILQIFSGQVQVLVVNFATLENPRLVSRHLRKLELTEVVLRKTNLDFASCPALEDLTMGDCKLFVDKISSQSVKRLKINSGDFFCACPKSDCRPTISVPSLLWLQLDSYGTKIPLLESMPLLNAAFVKHMPNIWSEDQCEIEVRGEEYCGICAKCTGADDHRNRCVLLGGLSSAINLELIAYKGTVYMEFPSLLSVYNIIFIHSQLLFKDI